MKKKIVVLAYSGSGKGHFLHREWYKSINAKVIPYVPLWIMPLAKKIPVFGAFLSFIYSFFIPKADVYLLDGIGAVTSVFFRKGKVLSINSDTFFRNLEKINPFKRFFSLLLVKRIDGFISTSKMMKELAGKYNKKPNEVAYPFVDLKKYSGIKSNLGSEDVCTIGAGTAKGTNRLIKAFKIYKKKYPASILYIVGVWPAGDSGRMLKEDNVILTGFDDPAKYFKKCGLYVNASWHESFGISILEAMYSGIPFLITENCGAKEIINDKAMITNLNSRDIAKKMILMKNNKKKIILIGKYKKIAEKFTKEKSIKGFKEAVAKLLEKTE